LFAAKNVNVKKGTEKVANGPGRLCVHKIRVAALDEDIMFDAAVFSIAIIEIHCAADLQAL